MKNFIKNSLVLVVLFTTLLGNANSSLKISIDETRTTLTLKDVKQGNELSIKDAYGIILYKELIQKSGNYVKGFDLTKLPNGSYFFELNKGLEIKTIPFTVESTVVHFDKEKATTFYKPVVKSVENKIYVSKLSLNKQLLEVKIYYDYNSGSYDLIHSETIEDTVNIQRVYKLSKSEKGNYKLVLKTEGRSFIEYLEF